MDGITSAGEVFVLASTNRIDSIDQALRRAGRFDREVYVGLPNQAHREEILRIHTKSWPVSSQLIADDLKDIASRTVGFSGADLRALCAEATLQAANQHLNIKNGASSSATCLDARSTEVASRLANIRVTIDDFHSALEHLSSSIHRHDVNRNQTQRNIFCSKAIDALIQPKLNEAMNVLNLTNESSNEPASGTLGEVAVMVVDDEDQDCASPIPFSLPTTFRRLLICGANPPPQLPISESVFESSSSLPLLPDPTSLLSSRLLARIDIESCIVHRLDIPTLMLDTQANTLAEACANKFQAAKGNKCK